MRVAAIIQARMGSSRFPGKVLRPIDGRAMLMHVVDHAERIPGVTKVAVATSTATADDAIANRCRGAGVQCVRGSETDVLGRYVQAAREVRAGIVIRLTADCPLLDPAVAGAVLRLLLEHPECGYASNDHPPTFYDGCDAEAFTIEMLHRADQIAGLGEREHVTMVMWQFWPMELRLNLAAPYGALDMTGMKLSVDRAEDYRRVLGVYHAMPKVVRGTYGWRDVVVAYRIACPDAATVRARKIFGRRPSAEPMRAAFVAGAGAAAEAVRAVEVARFDARGGVLSTLSAQPNPYSTEPDQRARRDAWAMGWEDAAELGLRVDGRTA